MLLIPLRSTLCTSGGPLYPSSGGQLLMSAEARELQYGCEPAILPLATHNAADKTEVRSVIRSIVPDVVTGTDAV